MRQTFTMSNTILLILTFCLYTSVNGDLEFGMPDRQRQEIVDFVEHESLQKSKCSIINQT